MSRSALELSSRALRRSPGLLSGCMALLVVAYWAARDGGFDPLRWLAGTLFFFALLTVAVAAGRIAPLPRATAAALAAFAAFAVWSFASILWAGSPGDAWAGSDKTLLYLSVFGLFVVFPWRAAAAAALTAGFSVAVATIGLGTVVRASLSVDPTSWFVGGKMIAPIAYANANAALYLMLTFPALYLSMRREVHPLLRGVLLATVGALLELALVIQSRASLAAFPFTLICFFIFVSGRARTLLGLLLAATAAIGASGTILGIYGPALTGVALGDALDDARFAIVVSVTVLGVIGAAIGFIDRRIELQPTFSRRAKLVVACGCAAVVVAASGAVVARTGNPWSHATNWAREFRTEKSPVTSPTTPYLASGLGGGRYDLWRVGWTLFRDHPLIGIGADNFAIEYARLRRDETDASFPHSIELRVLSQTGLVGAALFVAFLVAAAAGVASSLRTGTALGRGVAGALAATFLYWLVHGSAEWFWEMPALASTAFAFLGIATRLGTGDVPVRPPRLPHPAAVAGGIAVLVLATASVALPWLSARDVDAALRGWRSDPVAAFARLDRARSLNPLSDEPDVYTGVIAGQIGRPALERRAFLRALERNPGNWYAYLELAVLEARSGRRDASRRRIATARRLNPIEPVLVVVQDWLAEGRIPTRSELDQLLLSRANHLQAGVR